MITSDNFVDFTLLHVQKSTADDEHFRILHFARVLHHSGKHRSVCLAVYRRKTDAEAGTSFQQRAEAVVVAVDWNVNIVSAVVCVVRGATKLTRVKWEIGDNHTNLHNNLQILPIQRL